FPCTNPFDAYMTSRVPPVGVGPTKEHCTTSRLNSSGDNIRAPASSNSPRLLWAPASEVHNTRAMPRRSFIGRDTSFSFQNLRLLNCIIRKHCQRLREHEAEQLGGLHVDDQLRVRLPLDGKVCRLRAVPDLVDVVRRP